MQLPETQSSGSAQRPPLDLRMPIGVALVDAVVVAVLDAVGVAVAVPVAVAVWMGVAVAVAVVVAVAVPSPCQSPSPSESKVKEDGGNDVRIVQGDSESYCYGWPPFTWIIT